MDSLDQLSEKIERTALISLHECCPSETKKELGLDLVECEDSVSACSSRDSSILINRVLGLGTVKEISLESVQFISSIYKDRDISNYFLHLYDDSLTAEVREFLNQSDFVQKRGWMKFRSVSSSVKPAQTSLRVEKVGLDHSDDFGAIVCEAFGMQNTSIPLLAGLASDERWHLFVSYENDEPAGAGALFVDGKAAWLEWGATHPKFRSRGSQASIMTSRLNLAAELGCEYVFTETGEAVDGDPQHSYKNILKAGFEESILRLNYAPKTA